MHLLHPSQLAHDEGAAGGEVHALVAEGRGGEEAIKSGADLLARAQALYEEIGEAAQVQLMMRRQGSLYLAAAIREALAGRAAERAAASRLTLATRHYERALSTGLLANASPPMLRCAAEARLELARFYNNWSGAGARLRHLEAALAHARAGLALVPGGGAAVGEAGAGVGARAGARVGAGAGAGAGATAELRPPLTEEALGALRELTREQMARGATAKAAQLKAEYREMLTYSRPQAAPAEAAAAAAAP